MEKLNKIIKQVLTFLIIFLVINYIMGLFIGDKDESVNQPNSLVFITTDNEYSRRQKVTLEISNNTSAPVVIPNECPGEPFNVYRYEDNQWVQKNANPEINCADSKEIILEPGDDIKIPYTSWNNVLFSPMGRFKIEFAATINGEQKNIASNEFLIVKEGLFRQLAIGIFYRPIYNGLIFLARVVPGHDLGLAIILLTIIIRTILLAPSQKAMRAQKRMQEIQPRLEKIKEKYSGDQQRIAMETMALWKEAKISPLSSCLPMLLQLPFLIALFYVIQGGLNPDNSYLLYAQYNNFSLHDLNVHFLGLDLTRVNIYVLPLIVGGLQFIQMKLTMGGKKTGKTGNEMAMATNMMTYIMPVMIAVFTASLPAGVGLYWGASTSYGIIQQLFVNKGKEKDPDEPTVKVINN